MFPLINTMTDPFLPTGKGMVASMFHGLKPDQKPHHLHSQLLALSHLTQILISEESMTFCSRNGSLHTGVFYETSLTYWHLAYTPPRLAPPTSLEASCWPWATLSP